jgi:hypothetical protein
MSDNILPLSVIKSKIHQKEPVAGLVFTNDRGATGTILAELSPPREAPGSNDLHFSGMHDTPFT